MPSPVQANAYPPIGDYGLIGDCHSAALVSRSGSVDWCVFERFDGRSVFARLLDWSRGGYFLVGPTTRATVTRRYLPATNILETRFAAPAGTVVLTDCFTVSEGSDPSSAEAVYPYRQLVRHLRGEGGEVPVHLEFQPRFDNGLTTPRLELHRDDTGVVYGGADGLLIQAQFPLAQQDIRGCRGQTVLRAGDERVVVLTYMLPHELRVEPLDVDEIRRRLAATQRYWTDWAARSEYDGPYRDTVVRSALALKALSNAPTGAIVAAPTTSLPEHIGGVRNWDYRYAWLRDAALNLYALLELGYRDEARSFMAWLDLTTAGGAEDLQIVYGVGGERFLPEFELAHLEGYRGSRPVRVGNAAYMQFQLDTYGYLLDTAWLYHRHGGQISPTFWELLRGVVDVVCARWQQPDHGIWEIRGEPQHLVSSNVMAWVALNRGIRLARHLTPPGPVAQWRSVRAELRRQIEARGIAPNTGAFMQAFESSHLDASNLLIPLVRFLPPDDPRVHATVQRIRRELAVDGLVHRYLDGDDGLPAGEGTFLVCSFWLVVNLALAGKIKAAQHLLEQLLGLANDLGLWAEQANPRTGELLGNFPQALTHTGLIGAATHLNGAFPTRTRKRRTSSARSGA
jgi:GH15 family glucan-1,4-alpha-glucosidase